MGSLLLVLCLSIQLAASQNLSQFVPQIADVELYPPIGNPYLGRQNVTWCCIKAIEESLYVANGALMVRPDHQDWLLIDNDTNTLVNNSASQFPCTAVYTAGDDTGAPVVRVPYAWMDENCPGWQISDTTNLHAWLQPLGGFLVPAVVFCLSVPRRRRIGIPRSLFMPDLSRTSSHIGAIPAAIVAGIIVLIDTVLWLGVCFAFAGPMILSGLYEALLDNRILVFVNEKRLSRRLTVDMRCRLLMIILIGNLDMAIDKPNMVNRNPPRDNEDGSSVRWSGMTTEPVALSTAVSHDRKLKPSNDYVRTSGWDETQGDKSKDADMASNTEVNDRSQSTSHSQPLHSVVTTSQLGGDQSNWNPPLLQSNRASNAATSAPEPSSAESFYRAPLSIHESQPSPWRHMEKLLYKIREYDDDTFDHSLSPRQAPLAGESARVRDEAFIKQVQKTKTRLRAMLHCQHSFGLTVGAPVIFFLGGFLFALIQSLTTLGDEDTALALAFGQWYMIIPHTAIVSGLLLAGNNPNILKGVFATEQEDRDDPPTFLGLKLELAYPSCYKAAWQWMRGKTKRDWIEELINAYKDKGAGSELDQLREKTTLAPLDWVLVLGETLLLVGVPFLLALLTAFHTPIIGMSCRSFTFLMYFCLQVAQVLLWVWAYGGPPNGVAPQFFRRGGWLDKHYFYAPTDITHFTSQGRKANLHQIWSRACQPGLWSIRILWCLIWYSSAFLLGLVAVTVALGGTLMQLLGVYSANQCRCLVSDWLKPLGLRPMVVLSLNSDLMISNAKSYWLGCAAAAISFMTVVSFFAWWYQRRMRDMFTECMLSFPHSINFEESTSAIEALSMRSHADGNWGSGQRHR